MTHWTEGLSLPAWAGSCPVSPGKQWWSVDLLWLLELTPGKGNNYSLTSRTCPAAKWSLAECSIVHSSTTASPCGYLIRFTLFELYVLQDMPSTVDNTNHLIGLEEIPGFTLSDFNEEITVGVRAIIMFLYVWKKKSLAHPLSW